jgi:predicted RNA-binding protein with TRAM domain
MVNVVLVSGAKEGQQVSKFAKVSVMVETNKQNWSIKEGRPRLLKVFSLKNGGDGEVEVEEEEEEVE